MLRTRTQPAPIYITPPAPTETPGPTSTLRPIRVYISGAVHKPAVYELRPDAILEDVISLAGGLTEEADRVSVNLALPLEDGMHVHIPVPGDDPVVDSATIRASSEESTSPDRININTATKDELDLLPGIGPSTAQKIINYRTANGNFVSVEDLILVPGIGPAKMDQIQDLISIE